MIPRTKFGDCSNEDCGAKNTDCIKVGRNLFCVKCRRKQKTQAQLSKQDKTTLSRKLHKDQNKSGNYFNAERANLIQDLDAAFSKYVRQKEATKNGYIECFTCGIISLWKNMDCGHFVPRANMGLRWDLRNLRPQCKTCNQHKYGEVKIFEKKLELETPGITKTLLEEARFPHKWSKEELKEMLIDIRHKQKIVDLKFVP